MSLLSRLNDCAMSDVKYCTKCKTDKDRVGFISLKGKPTKYCGDCLNESREHEKTRAKRERDYKTYESQPEVKIRKKKWRQDNHEKTVFYYKKYRLKKFAEDGKNYLAHNAKMQKQWRENNPDKYQVLREKEVNNIARMQATYKQVAMLKGIPMNLTDANMELMFTSDCWYCGKTSNDKLNGIDRLDPGQGYNEVNCRSCCKECNYSKGALSHQNYIAQLSRILIHLNPDVYIINELHILLEDTVYESLNGSSYASYFDRAIKKNLDFELTHDQFDKLSNANCYLCGNKPSVRNGIDRFDNNLGYVLSNCNPCCNTCNLIKRDETFKEFYARITNTILLFSEKNVSEFRFASVTDLSSSLKTRMLSRTFRPEHGFMTRGERSIITNGIRNKCGITWINADSKRVAQTATPDDLKLLEQVSDEIRIKIEEENSKIPVK